MSPNTLTPSTALLISERLRPGDVILTRGMEKESLLIAVSTAGPFSHAALVLNESSVFEALDDGVGYNWLRPVCSGSLNGQRIHCVRLGSTVSNIKVLRHRHLKSISSHRVHSALDALVREFLGHPYSIMRRLAEPLIWIVRPVARWLLGRKDPADKRRPEALPGVFCSELIAQFFQGLSIPLFGGARRPEQISPNELWRLNGITFDEVQNVILLPEDMNQMENCISTEHAAKGYDPAMRQWLPRLVQSRIEKEILEETSSRISTVLQNYATLGQTAFIQAQIQLLSMMESNVTWMNQYGDHRSAGRMCKLMDEYFTQSPLAMQYLDGNVMPETLAGFSFCAEAPLKYIEIHVLSRLRWIRRTQPLRKGIRMWRVRSTTNNTRQELINCYSQCKRERHERHLHTEQQIETQARL